MREQETRPLLNTMLTYVCLKLLHLDGILHELPLLIDLPLTKENQRVLGDLPLQVHLVLSARREKGLRDAV